MNKRTAIAAMAAITIIAPFATAFGEPALGGTCRFYCHVKNGGWGWYDACNTDLGPYSSDTVLYAYKIVRDGEGNPTGLGANVTNARYPQTSLGSTGYNYILEVVTTTASSSDTYAVNGEQLALVVKNGSGTELWRSYTALPPCAWASVSVDGFEASGIIDASYSDGNGDGLNDEWAEAVNSYADAYGVNTLNGASGDADGDGLTNGQEFMYGTDPIGGVLADYFPVNTITLKNWSVLDETTRKATVTIDGMDSHAYSIRYTTDLAKTGKTIGFSTTNGGDESTKYIYHDAEADPGAFSQQVWFTLPDPKTVGTYYVGIAVDGVLAVYTMVAPVNYTMTWLNDDGSEIDTTQVVEGTVPVHADPSKASEGAYSYEFTGWTPAIETAVSNTTYTATYRKVVDLSRLSGNYTAVDGDVMINSTTYSVTIPAGASVTMNGVTVNGASGGESTPAPAFSTDGKAATTEFTQGTGGKWTLTTFAELANDALGKDVADEQIKVYASDTLQGLESAEPMAGGVEVKEKKSAVMTTIEVTTEAPTQFFKVKFGE